MKATILIVDDETFVLEEMTEAFEDEGYRVMSASDMAGALAILEAGPVDLLVTDLKMPGGSGIELYRRAPTPAPPAILLSGHGADSNRIEAMAAGFSECLAKPVDLDDLLAVIDSLV